MAERTRTFTGTLIDHPARDGWQQAHDDYCRDGIDCTRHTNPYLFERKAPVLVHLFEETSGDGISGQRIVGMEVALKSGEDRFSRWGRPAKMTEEDS